MSPDIAVNLSLHLMRTCSRLALYRDRGTGVTFFVLRNFSPKDYLSACYPPEDFGEGATKDFRPFLITWRVFFFFICKGCFECAFFDRR